MSRSSFWWPDALWAAIAPHLLQNRPGACRVDDRLGRQSKNAEQARRLSPMRSLQQARRSAPAFDHRRAAAVDAWVVIRVG